MNTRPPRTILLVEDSRDDALLLRRLLRETGREYTLIEATSGEEALELARRDGVDVILLDYFLPDTTGMDFLADLRRESPRGAPVPVVILTGHEDQEVAVEVLSRGAMDYLVKGTMSGSGLIRAVENAIEKFAIQRELEEKRASLELRNWELETLRDELQTRLLELADAHRAKDQFLAVMSHEMRTPLNAILGYADLLDFGVAGDLTEAQRAHLNRIQVGGRHLLDLINDVLDLARADARKLELDMRPVDLGAVLEEVAGLLENEAETKGLELVVEPCLDDLPLVQADLQRLRQVLTNLVGNAIKFTDEGSVSIRCDFPNAEQVQVHVVDTGIGIDPDILPLIFGEFYQAEGELTRQHGGSGLGLAISQRLARLMGGDVLADSRVGEGSDFTLILRRAAEGSEARPEDVALQQSRMEVHAGGRRPEAERVATVVAFGDDAGALAGLATQVKPAVRLVWTTDAAGVPDLARREQAVLVVLELASAGGAAWRAAHAMQDLPELTNTAVLLLPRIPTTDADEAGGISLGWVSLVPKPFTPQQLSHAVARAASNAREDADIPASDTLHVLVVDDDPDSRRVATRFLVGEKTRVEEAADGESALVMMRRRQPDVVVLDLMMPVLDGFGVLATMRADPLLSSIPVVVLSAKTLTQAEREFLSRTAVRVLQKGEHRLADVASLVLRAAASASRPTAPPPAPPPGDPPPEG